MSKKVRKIVGSVAPLAAFIPGVGLPLAVGLGAGGGLLAGGGLKGALSGGLSAGAIGGGGTLLGNALGATGATGSALGGSLLGAAAGGINDGFKGAALGAGLGGLGGYAQGGGFDNILDGTKLGDYLGGNQPTGATSLTPGGVGASSTPAVSGGGFSSYAGGGPEIDLTKGLFEGANSLTDYTANNLGNITSSFGDLTQVTPMAGNKLSSILSSGFGIGANNDAQKELLKAQQQALAQIQPFQTASFNPGDLQNDPGYQFAKSQGLAALDARNAASGNYYSGAAQQQAGDYVIGLADQTYNNAYQRWLANQGLNLGAANTAAGIYSGIGDVNANAGIANSNLLSRGLSGILGGGGFNAQGQSFDNGNNDALMRLLYGRA